MKEIIFWIFGILTIIGIILSIMYIDEDDLS